MHGDPTCGQLLDEGVILGRRVEHRRGVNLFPAARLPEGEQLRDALETADGPRG